VGAVDDQRRCACEDEEQLLVVALNLVVLGDRLTGWQLHLVDTERGDAERAPDQHPLAVLPLELVVVPDGEAAHAPSFRRSPAIVSHLPRPGQRGAWLESTAE